VFKSPFTKCSNGQINFVSGGRPEASKRNLNFQAATWHHLKHLQSEITPCQLINYLLANGQVVLPPSVSLCPTHIARARKLSVSLCPTHIARARKLSVSLCPTHTARARKRERGEIARGSNPAMVGDKSKGECRFLCFYGAL